ncbi:MAG: hypothetical protein H0V70_29305 [Ktedonobacteraceae bacterium]|nr:hypothetical protein [Ktedonobacteraceae bacterium]
MYSLTRLLFRALNGRPVAQLIVGIIMLPVGGLISLAAVIGDGENIYPYWIIMGIVFVVVGIVFIVRSTKHLLSKSKSSVGQAPYGVSGHYAPPVYGQSQAPYGQLQVPYGQPPYGQQGQPQVPYGQPYPSEYIPAQPQAPYGQTSYPPPPYTPGQHQ